MNEKQQKTISKFLSLILRHSPETIQLELDENGWADVQELLTKAARHGQRFSPEELETVVANDNKQRFAFDETHTRIRANQGHSITVDLGLQPQTPPTYLYHGTVGKFLDNIQKEGLQKMSRQHLHLSVDKATAEKVGSRRGRPVILTIKSGQMHQDGLLFFLSENGVWLTDHVPARYIDL